MWGYPNSVSNFFRLNAKEMLNFLPFEVLLSICDKCVKIVFTVGLSGRSEIIIIYT